MEIIYDLLTGLVGGVLLILFIYFASKFQMKAWLDEINKFLENKITKFKKDDNKT